MADRDPHQFPDRALRRHKLFAPGDQTTQCILSSLTRPPADYEAVKATERDQLRRERVRLWYVAITRACDSSSFRGKARRKGHDWMSIVDLRLDDLPSFDPLAIVYAPDLPDCCGAGKYPGRNDLA